MISLRRFVAMGASVALSAALITTPAAGQLSVGQEGTFLIQGGTVVVTPGQEIANGSVLIRDGMIAQVGQNIQAPAGATVIDASGKTVFPGMMDGYTTIGLQEIGGIATMNLTSELGDHNPHNRAIVAINVDSEMIGITRVNGVTNVLTAPTGGVMSGQAAVIHLAGWTWEEMTTQEPGAFVLNYPSAGGGRGRGFGFGGRGGGPSVEDRLTELRRRLREAGEYDEAREAGSSSFDLQYESMRPLMRGDVPAIVSANTEEEIRAAVALEEQYGIDVIIRGGREAWKIADFLAQNDVPVVLSSIQSTPGNEDPYDAIYAAPGVLNAAGVKFAFSTGGASSARHVPFHAELAVAYGLPLDAAHRALTIWPAEIYGVDNQLGTIEAGKIANLFVTTGDPLDVRSVVTEVFIKGRLLPFDDRHTELYEKYNSRGGNGN